MTRLYTDGAEFGDLLFWDNLGGAVRTTPRSGVYNYGAQGNFWSNPEKYTPDLSDFYFRFGSAIFDAHDFGFWLWGCNHGGTQVIRIYMDSSQLLHFYVGDTSVVTGTRAYLWDVYHLIDMHIQIGASGVLELKMDGVLELYYTGDTRGNSQTHMDRFWFSSGSSLGHYPVHEFDDIALNDTTGYADNFWCGDGHVELLRPNANGDTNQWIGSDGNIEDNYLLIDDVPPDNDTTYVGTILSSQYDMYGLSNYNGTQKVVKRVWAETRAKDMSAVGQSIKLGFKTHGTVYLCDQFRTLTYNYLRVAGDQAIVNPTTLGTWTEAELDDLQFVIESGTVV